MKNGVCSLQLLLLGNGEVTALSHHHTYRQTHTQSTALQETSVSSEQLARSSSALGGTRFLGSPEREVPKSKENNSKEQDTRLKATTKPRPLKYKVRGPFDEVTPCRGDQSLCNALSGSTVPCGKDLKNSLHTAVNTRKTVK